MRKTLKQILHDMRFNVFTEDTMVDYLLQHDVVPVVRCKYCKYSRNMPFGLCYLHTEPCTNEKGYKGEAICVEPNDFCSYGEIKNG